MTINEEEQKKIKFIIIKKAKKVQKFDFQKKKKKYGYLHARYNLTGNNKLYNRVLNRVYFKHLSDLNTHTHTRSKHLDY